MRAVKGTSHTSPWFFPGRGKQRNSFLRGNVHVWNKYRNEDVKRGVYEEGNCCFSGAAWHLTVSITSGYPSAQVQQGVVITAGTRREAPKDNDVSPFPVSLRRPWPVVLPSDSQANCRSSDCGNGCVQTHFQHHGSPTQRALLLTSQLEDYANARHSHKMADMFDEQCLRPDK